jgi:hypothetical protein
MVAVMVTVTGSTPLGGVDEATKEAVVRPAATVTEEGTLSVALSFEVRLTVMSLCAGALSSTSHVAFCPPTTEVGVHFNDFSTTITGVLVDSGTCVCPGPGGPAGVDGLWLGDAVAVAFAVGKVDAVDEAWGIVDGAGSSAPSMPTGLFA